MFDFLTALFTFSAFVIGFLVGSLATAGSFPLGGEFFVQSFAVLVGASAAFAFQGRHRKEDQRQAQVTAGNRTLLDIIHVQNHLMTYKAQVLDKAIAASPAPTLWATLPGIHLESEAPDRLDIGRLEFLLGGGSSQVVAEIDLLRSKHAGFIQAINQRTEVLLRNAHPRWAAAGLVPGGTVTSADLARIVGPNVHAEIRDLTDFILESLPQYIADTDRVFRDVRGTLNARFHDANFIDIAPAP